MLHITIPFLIQFLKGGSLEMDIIKKVIIEARDDWTYKIVPFILERYNLNPGDEINIYESDNGNDLIVRFNYKSKSS